MFNEFENFGLFQNILQDVAVLSAFELVTIGNDGSVENGNKKLNIQFWKIFDTYFRQLSQMFENHSMENIHNPP